MRYLLVGGGTAGHINPALAIAEKIKSEEKDAEIFFAGTPKGMESKLVPKAGYEFFPIEVAGIQRRLSFGNIKRNIIALHYLAKSGGKAKKIINKVKPDVVIGTGGYVSGPIVRMAQKMGIKTAIHEQNAFPGVTTKLLAKKADMLMLAVADSASYFPQGQNYRVVGNPVRSSIIFADRSSSRKALGIDERPLILSFGGSLGARKINETVADVIAWHSKEGKYQHIHGVGKSGMEWMPQYLKDKGITPDGKTVRVLEYIDDMDKCMAAADIVICRAGAIALSEIEVMGKPAILVPSPYVAENHQYHNAMALADKGAAIVIEEKNLTGDLLIKTLKDLLSDSKKLSDMSKRSKELAVTDSTDRIYKAIKEIMR